MSKKIIGPALPPNLQHLLASKSEEINEHKGISVDSKCTNDELHISSKNSTDDEDDDAVLVLNVSDDEGLNDLTGNFKLCDRIEKSRPSFPSQERQKSSRSYVYASSDEDSLGPAPSPNVRLKPEKSAAIGFMDVDLFRPASPPSLKNKSCQSPSDNSSDEESFCPALPSHLRQRSLETPSVKGSIGPALPSNFKLKAAHSSSDNSSDEESFGPALPPNLKQTSSKTTPVDDAFSPALPSSLQPKYNKTSPRVQPPSGNLFGPTLPPNFTSSPDGRTPSMSSKGEGSFGPSLPPNFRATFEGSSVIGPTLPPELQTTCSADQEVDVESEEDDGMLGPLPPTHASSADQAYVQYQLEARALQMKLQLAGKGGESSSEVQSREAWMLELPPDRAKEFGLGPRQFRARAKQDLGDRSVWTDTPRDKERKANDPYQADVPSTSDLKMETEMLAIAERDKEMQKLTDKHNKKKKRKESLIDLHQKKLKKKQKKEEEKGKNKERRPFDRNVDLQANRFDEAQKKAILRKAQLLDDRFSRGESKFL